MKFSDENAWSFIARTYLLNRFVTRLAQHGADTIVNLAAGLDTTRTAWRCHRRSAG